MFFSRLVQRFGIARNFPVNPILNFFQDALHQRNMSKVKTLSDGRKRFLIKYKEAQLNGVEFKLKPQEQVETRFWKAIDGMKVFKPVTNGVRNRKVPTRFHLHKGRCVYRLSQSNPDSGGRNITGKITIRHRGGGHKKRIRAVDYYRQQPGPQEVIRIEHDPNRSSQIALIRHMWTNEFSYIICPKGVKPGNLVESWLDGKPKFNVFDDSSVSEEVLFKPGNCFRVGELPIGTAVHCIGLVPGGPGIMCRSAGNHAKIVSSSNGKVTLSMPSNEIRTVDENVCATVGIVGNEGHAKTCYGKAGVRRNMGIRPTVRGIAQNPSSHPHGGGTKNKKHKQSRSVWGKITRGIKTVRRYKPHIVASRQRRRQENKSSH